MYGAGVYCRLNPSLPPTPYGEGGICPPSHQIQQDLSANRCAIDLLTELFEYGYGNGLERAHAYVLIIEIKSNHPFYTRYSKEGNAKLLADLQTKQKE